MLLKKGLVLEQQGQPEAALKVYKQCVRESQRIELSSTGVVGGLGGGAAGVAASGVALSSPVGIFGMGVWTVIGVLSGGLDSSSPGTRSAYRKEATRLIENIKAGKQNKITPSISNGWW